MNARDLPFLTALDEAPADAPALFDDNSIAWLTYGELRERVNALSVDLMPNHNASPRTSELSACAERCADPGSRRHAVSLTEGQANSMHNKRSRATRGHVALDPGSSRDKEVALVRDDAWGYAGSLLPKNTARPLTLCCLPRTIDGVIAYLAAAKAGHAIILTDPEAPNLEAIIDAYHPDWIVSPEGQSTNTSFQTSKLHPDLYLLLLTSGSTGSSKGVRLSYANIAANTNAIIKSLSLTENQTALCHLPLSYSFGLSVLHTQLAAGGRCLLTEKSMMDGAFWQLAREQEATLFAGVPYHYEMLMRLGLARLKLPKLTTFLQAGGKMHVPLAQKALDEIQRREDGKLFIMYGQTEASPRISSFPLHLFPQKIGSSGMALDGTHLEIADGEIIVNGPHVMMGYANNRDDLALGDVMKGRLPTGDMGTLDDDGYVTITGRKRRFAKLFGQRVALDDLEKIASPLALCIAIEHPEKVILFALGADVATLAAIKEKLTRETKLPAPWIDVRALETLPTKANGKTDYQALQGMVSGSP